MRLIRIILLLLFVLSLSPASVRAQTPTPPTSVRLVLDAMTPEERIGQLFMVAFNGTDTGAESQIYDLIVRHHVGGVVLMASNDNFSGTDTPAQAHSLIEELQRLEWNASVNSEINPFTGQREKVVYAPLFIGIAQEGDGYPTDQILTGLTPMPSEMAIGATWNIGMADQMGEIRGRELAALGFNFLIGPSLDVLDSPTTLGGDLGTRVFGGDPFWVGEMGRAYVTGLHRGSDGKMFVVAKHFPGVGGADRLPEEEVSTVRKSLEQLKQIELAPFFSVTNISNPPEMVVDGLLVSHIRYQGFQGNIRATTRPVSFDSQALGQILTLPQFLDWFEAGGLLVSDDLGTNAVRSFYESGGGQFLARVAARDAFLAGNDILYLGNIKSNDAPDSYTTVIRILDFFTQKYREDPAFAERVNESVTRILTAKFEMYGSFALANVLVSKERLADLGSAADVTFAVARSSASLVSPDLQDLTTIMPLPPQPNERVVFLTDAISVKQCSECQPQPVLVANALETATLRLYGPDSGNQVEGFRLSSHSFQTLQAFLDSPDENQFLADDLDNADWVVVSIADSSQRQPALISRFLRERPDLLRDKRVILFSFGAPYYFDTTTISKFTAYYALYSKQPQFVDVAVRLLFQELTPIGSSPVSISAVGYDMIKVMAPNPAQIIPLFLDLPPAPVTPGALFTPEATPIPLFRIGDTIDLRTGVIKDHNGRPVPDGTVVQFSMVLTGEGGGILQQVEAVTTQGVARASFGLDKPGLLEIRVSSEPAVVSEVLQLDVSQSGAVAVTVVVPELTQSTESSPAPLPAEEEEEYISQEGYPRFFAWFISMLMVLLGGVVVYSVAYRLTNRTQALRWSLGMLLGGLTAYNVLSFGLFGITNWIANSGLTGVVVFTFVGQALGFFGGWLWSRR